MNATTTKERDADLGGGAAYHDCSVWMRAAGAVLDGDARVAAAAG